MPIIKSAKKQLRQSRKRQARNLTTANFMKNNIKGFMKLVEEDPKKAQAEFAKVQKIVDTAAKKRVISDNRASRIVSRLNRALNSAGK